MKYGYVRTAAATPKIRVADCGYNCKSIIDSIKEAWENNSEVVVLPELCITGYTCGDLFLQRRLLDSAIEGLLQIKNETKSMNIVSVVGLPYEYNGDLYNTAAVMYKGSILGLIPKSSLPNYNEFYEKRWFTEAISQVVDIEIGGETVPFGTDILFRAKNAADWVMAVEICEDLWTTIPPSSYHANAGATIIANLSAGNEITGKDVYRNSLVTGQSGRLICGYIYASAGDGESTTDVVFAGHNLIAENGALLAESQRFVNGIIYGDIDLMKLGTERRRNTSFRGNVRNYRVVEFKLEESTADINRYIDPSPFVPSDSSEREKRCKEIIDIQAHGLKKRIEHIGCKNIVIGISGGLDSTQALIVADRAYELLGLDKKGIITVTMPCFGTTDRTYNNAIELCNVLGTTLLEVNIRDAVNKHFEDIGHNSDINDLVYENSQARERTQILMDLAAKYNGFVVGTGDLSELALGWATYNGDHMSMYGVNNSVPKTLIRYLIRYIADYTDNGKMRDILLDILDTPVSPELLPPDKEGNIAQITEDVVGPYELHDFFLYNMMRLGFTPDKIYYLAQRAFAGVYDKETILKWLKKFYWRFFSQQFKRSCMPDGPKVGSVSLSPRGDWRMPSDANVEEWMKILEIAENKGLNKEIDCF